MNLALVVGETTLWVSRLVVLVIIITQFRPTKPKTNCDLPIRVMATPPAPSPANIGLPTMLIEPPPRYSSPEVFREFLKELDGVPDSPEVRSARKQANDDLKFAESRSHVRQ